MGLLFQTLLLTCCGVGILHASFMENIKSGIGTASNFILNAADVGVLKVFDYKTDYNATEMVNKMATGMGITANYVFNNNSGVIVSEKVIFYCINSKTKTLQKTEINDADITSKILEGEPLVLVIHGWIDNAFRNWVQNILNAWIHTNTGTICAVDWSYLANYEYSISATKYVYEVAEIVSNWLTVTTAIIGITNDQVNLIGHSLGGQISGMVGMHQNGTIAKMFCLDPAGPLYCSPTPVHKDRRLDPTDAKFVQVIMTTWGIFGCADMCGHQTFYPNDGTAPQAGCYAPILQKGLAPEIISCSHSYACQLFWWSLFPENDFTSNECYSYPAYLAGSCKGSNSDQLGWYHKKTTGVYYLTTKSKPPSGNPSAPSLPN